MVSKISIVIYCFILIISLLSGSLFVVCEDVYRLSNNTKPLSYELELTVDTSCDAEEFSGQVNITIQAVETHNAITLHTSKNMSITTIEIFKSNSGGESINVIGNELIDKTEIRTITLAENLDAGATYIIEISYTALISNDKLGLYRSTYTNDKGEKVCILSTQFAPTQARRAFPCYDEPAFKTIYDIRIIHPTGTLALSNEMPINLNHRDDNTVLTIFNKVDLLPSYLVGFAIADFGYEENKTGEILHQVYSRREELNHVFFALDFGANVYTYLANYFNLKLPLTHLKHIAIPEFYFSAMENWGMITYKESRLLFNPTIHPVNLEHTISNVIGHEVTHHWFGDLVTMKWWTYVWLKEGFATLFSYYGQDAVRPDHQAIQFLLAEKLQFVFNIDSDPDIKPMSKYIEVQSDIMANYDKIAYDKACCVLRMFRHAFTEPVFKEAISNYIFANKFSNTDEDDLFEAFQIAMNKYKQDLSVDVAEIMSSWTQQSGYPVVTVRTDGSVISLNQERFYHKNPKEEPENPAIWWIPITFSNLNGGMRQYWMNESHVELNCVDYLGSCRPDQFFLLNFQQTGYYRVNYEEEHWKTIANTLKNNHLRVHVNNRAQIIDDAFNLAFVGRLSYSAVFDIVQYISNEEDYAPWMAFKRGVSTLKQYLSGNPDAGRLNQFVQNVVDQAYNNVALMANIPRFIRKFSRQVIVSVACEFGLKACLQERRDYSYPDMREIYYCNKLRVGGNNIYSTLRNLLKNTSEPILRGEVISSLGCSNDRSQLAVLLLMAIDKTDNYMLTEAERVQIIQSVYRKSYLGVVETMKMFANENVKAAITDTKEVEKLCIDFAKYINTYELSLMFNDIIEKVLSTEKFKEAQTIVRENLFWIADYGANVLNILSNRENSAGSLCVYVSVLVSSFVALSII